MFQSHLFSTLQHKSACSLVFIGYHSIQNSIFNGAFQSSYLLAGFQIESFHDFFSTDRWLEIANAVALFKILQFLTHQLEIIKKTLQTAWYHPFVTENSPRKPLALAMG